MKSLMLLLSCLLMSACCTAELSGVVRDVGSGEPISGASVVVFGQGFDPEQNPPREALHRAITDAEGKFSAVLSCRGELAALQPYGVEVSAPGFIPENDLVIVDGSEETLEKPYDLTPTPE
ncbi:carboxypeptidase-like regulatory domain-containing protein [Planctomycetota bacterium]|nr:carboxypeptidase-like regulatory domain-containing protein [Planctomycetota bacterium]